MSSVSLLLRWRDYIHFYDNSSAIRQNLKMEVTRKQSTPNFPKNKHFLTPVIRQKGESQNGGNKKAKHAKFSERRKFFFGKFGLICFLFTTFWDLPFFLISDELYIMKLFRPFQLSIELYVETSTNQGVLLYISGLKWVHRGFEMWRVDSR